MVERVDPARTGVLAGRVVGVLTAALAVASLAAARQTYYDSLAPLVAALLESAGFGGVDASTSLVALFWSNAVFAAAARYAVCYVVGSLVGVVYEWLDRPSLWALAGLVTLVGVVDGALAALDTRSAAVGAGYVAAWLCYVPAFAWLFDGEPDGSGGSGAGAGRARRLDRDREE